MIDYASPFLARLAWASLFLAASGMVAGLVLWSLRVRAPRVHAVSCWLVLIQGVLLFHLSLDIPWYAAPQAMPESLVIGPPEIPRPALESVETVGLVTIEQAAETSRAAERLNPAHVHPIPATGFQWPTLLLSVWAIGIALIIARWVRNYVWFCKSCGGEECGDASWTQQWQRLVDDFGVKRRIPLYVGDQVGPVLCWLPSGYRLIVPSHLWRGLTRLQRLCILRHELAHYERGDVWKSLLCRLCALLHWFNPVAWWAVRRIERSSEWACDDVVAGAGEEWSTHYAKALLAVGEIPTPQPTWTPAAGGSGLPRRIRRVLSLSRQKESQMKTVLPVSVLLIMAALNVIRIELVAQEQVPTDEKQSERGGADSDGNETTDPAGKVASDSPRKADFQYRLHKLGFHRILSDPRRLPHLTDLHSLGLQGERFSEEDLKVVAGFTDLKKLGIFGTNITAAGLQHLKTLQKLETLVLVGPLVTDDWLEVLPEFPMLQGLNLSGGRITDDGLKELPEFPTLRGLNLSGSRITDDGLRLLGAFPNLKGLTLDETEIDGSGLDVLQQMPNLRSLNLKPTRVTDESLSHLQGLTQLENLSLESPNVTGSGLVHLHGLENLRHLTLTGPSVTDDWMQAVKPLRTVDWFTLRRTNVTAAGLSAISEWTKLRRLHVYGSPISDEIVPHLGDLYLLDHIELFHTPITEEGVRRLRNLLPDAMITARNPETES